MNLLDLFVRVSAKDEASSQVEQISENIIGKLGGAAATAGKALAALWAGSKVVEFGKQAFAAYSQFEQLAGGAAKIFDEIDQSRILNDANGAWKTLNMSANEYLGAINQTGAMFAQTMGDEAGYEAAKRGMQAISDYATGTGRDINELNTKFSMITRAASSYQSIADQFAGILPATSADFLAQAQAAGFLSGEYTKLTEVPIAEYQQAVSQMLEKGVSDLGLAGNTAREALTTLEGSMLATKSAWANLVAEFGKPDADIGARVADMMTAIFGVNGEGGLARNMVSEVGTIVTNMTRALSNAVEFGFNWLVENGPSLALNAVSGLVDTLTEWAASLAENPIDIVGMLFPEDGEEGGIAERLWTMLTNIAEIFREWAPDLMEAVGALAEQVGITIATNGPALLEKIGEILTGLVAKVAEYGPQVVYTVANAVLQAVAWFTGHWPEVLSTVGSALGEMVKNVIAFLVQNGPTILSTAIEMFKALATAIMENLPTILGNIATVVGQVVGFIVGAAGLMFSAAIKWVGGLLDGSTQQGQAVRNFFANLPQTILSALGDLGTLLWNAGSSIISGLWNGMMSAAGGLFDWVGSIAGTIASLKGPLPYDKKVLVENGLALMGGLRGGMQKGFEEDVLPYVKGMASDISGNMSFSAVNNGTSGSSAPQFSLYIDKLTVRNRDDADYFAEQINDIWRQQIEGSLA